MSTPQEKADSIQAQHGDKFQRLLRFAQRIPDLPRNFDYKAESMFAVIDEMAAMIKPAATCKKGCDFCCHQAVVISTWETRRIAKFSGRRMTDFEGYDYSTEGLRGKVIAEFNGMACPFLKDRNCSIYDVVRHRVDCFLVSQMMLGRVIL